MSDGTHLHKNDSENEKNSKPSNDQIELDKRINNKNLIETFVSLRFVTAGTFILLYYVQFIFELQQWVKIGVVSLLTVVLLIAICANYLWIKDYARRIQGGINHIRSAGRVKVSEVQGLEQVRWTNAQILALIAIILAVIAQYDKIKSIPEIHRVPVLVFVLLVLVALFDAALDLEAEWTVSILSSIASSEHNPTIPVSLASVIWHANQHRLEQMSVCLQIIDRTQPASTITFRSFTSAAQNLISFAIIAVASVCVVSIAILWSQL